MKKGGRAKKVMKKMEKAIKKSVKKVTQEAAGLKKEIAAEKKELGAKVKELTESLKKKVISEEKMEKLAAQKDSLIGKLRKELAEKGKIIQESKEILRETFEKAEKEVSDLKKKTDQGLRELKSEAQAEARKLKEELEAKGKALSGKIVEFDEYRKAAEGKIFELQAKVKEFTAKIVPGEKERPGLVAFKGRPLTLIGREVKVGDKAPDFRVMDNAMQPVTLESFKGKVKIITSVPSLDTPVCDMETRRFNEEAAKLSDRVTVLTISMDLPFAQARWCAAAGVENVKTFSDYQDRSFGLAYGVLVKELKLLARAVFIVDDQDVVRYVQLVPEITREPDYDQVIKNLPLDSFLQL